VQEFEDSESERFLLLLRFAPGSLGCDQVGEERVQAGGSAAGGEAVGRDGATKLGFEPEGCCFDVASDGACAWVLSAVDAVTCFDGPCEGADELDGLGAVGQEGFYVGTGDARLIEPLNKMSGSRVSSVVIASADTTSLLLGESRVESVQSRDSGGR